MSWSVLYYPVFSFKEHDPFPASLLILRFLMGEEETVWLLLKLDILLLWSSISLFNHQISSTSSLGCLSHVYLWLKPLVTILNSSYLELLCSHWWMLKPKEVSLMQIRDLGNVHICDPKWSINSLLKYWGGETLLLWGSFERCLLFPYTSKPWMRKEKQQKAG